MYAVGKFIDGISFIVPLLIILLLMQWLFDIKIKRFAGILRKVRHVLYRLSSARRNSEKMR